MISKNINNNIVNPIVPLTGGACDVERKGADLNTFFKLSPLFLSLAVSSSKGGKYNLNVTDYKNGFYFIYEELGYRIKVPLTAIFNTNDKTAGILGIAFSTARECPSRALGLCQLEDTELCYARAGEKQGTKKSCNYLQGMGSYQNGQLSQYYFDLFYSSQEIRETFKRYCNYYNIDTLRFNLKGDFKGLEDIKSLEYIAEMGLSLTGYTARDDLRAELLDLINSHDNIILNGSNMMYNNAFNVVYSFKELFSAEHQCKGGCLKNGCMNCYRLKNVIITVLAHGSQAGVRLNTPENRAFIIDLFKSINIDIKEVELSRGADIYKQLNKALIKRGVFDSGIIPARFLKVTDSGTVKYDSANAIIAHFRYLLHANGGVLNE